LLSEKGEDTLFRALSSHVEARRRGMSPAEIADLWIEHTGR
jgi:hypothetical protein